VPGTESLALGRLRWRHREGETRISAGQRKSFDRYRPLEIAHDRELTRRLSMTAVLGRHQPAPESAAVRVAGMKDDVTLGLRYRLSRFDRVSAQWSWRNFLMQNGTHAGDGRNIDVEYAHAIRNELRDLEASVFFNRFSFEPRLGAAADSGFAPYLVLLPRTTQALLAQGASTSEQQAEVESSVRGLLPSDSRLYGIRVSTNTRLQRDYTRALRPFGSVSLTHNSASGSGYDVLLGVAGSIVGNDHFQLGWQSAKGGSASFARTREFRLSYRLFF
jgi:hypothetical protein